LTNSSTHKAYLFYPIKEVRVYTEEQRKIGHWPRRHDEDFLSGTTVPRLPDCLSDAFNCPGTSFNPFSYNIRSGIWQSNDPTKAINPVYFWIVAWLDSIGKC
jgi:hypothetical protein